MRQRVDIIKIPDIRIKRKDRYGILRCAVLLSLFLVFAMGLNMFLHGNRDTLAAEERANDATRQIAAQFHQLIEDSVFQMDMSGSYLRSGTDVNEVLDKLGASSVFSASAVLENGHIIASVGDVNLQDNILKSADHVYNGVPARIIAQDDNAIQLRISVEGARELAAWIAPERVQQVLGRAFDEEYGYAVFNDDTGLYLINHTHFKEHGYYDALLARNGSGAAEQLLNQPVAQAFISRDATSDGPYYIAQMPTEIDSWSIALVISQDMIDFNEGMPKGLYWIGLVTIAISVLAVILVSCYVWTRIKRVNKRDKKENELLNQLAELAAVRGQISVFLYRRKEDSFDHYIDGFSKKIVAGERGIFGLAEICGFESGEAERLRERCIDMKTGTESEINVHAHINGEERFWRICLKCSSDENVILGCIQDCTQGVLSQNRIIDEENFYEMMQPKASTIWKVNVSRNQWQVSECVDTSILKNLGISGKGQRDYEADLNNAVRRYLHPEDYSAYAEEMSLTGLMTMFRKGKIETVHEYRAKNGKKSGFEWYRQLVRVFQSPETMEIMANIFIINVDAEKKAEMERRERSRMLQRSLTALGGIYRALFYVDLDNDICYTTKAPGGELISEHQSVYSKDFAAFIDRSVAPEDHKKLKDFTSSYMLRKNLNEARQNLHCEYLRISGDNYKRTVMIVQAARFENGTVRDVVIALRSIE